MGYGRVGVEDGREFDDEVMWVGKDLLVEKGEMGGRMFEG